jgi:hypothetical protein
MTSQRRRPIAWSHSRTLTRPSFYTRTVIVSLHAATGAAGGALVRSRRRAVALGLVLHALGDRMPHQDVASVRFETASGIAAVLGLAARHGPLSPVVVGALAASAPDLEHVVPLPRPGGRKLFPTHRVPGWHREGGVPAWAQLLAAGVILGTLLAQTRSHSSALVDTVEKRPCD